MQDLCKQDVLLGRREGLLPNVYHAAGIGGHFAIIDHLLRQAQRFNYRTDRLVWRLVVPCLCKFSDSPRVVEKLLASECCNELRDDPYRIYSLCRRNMTLPAIPSIQIYEL